jgi:hypothetical protein
MTLVRKETKRGHTYALDGAKVTGVTTILNGGLPKPQLVAWAARSVAEYVADNPDQVKGLYDMGREPMISALKATPYQSRDDAAARGTHVHALAESLLHGQSIDVPDYVAGHVKGYVDFIDRLALIPVLTEKPVASRTWWYAGTFDAIADIGAGPLKGKRLLLDWKTSKGVYGETALQLAAYANAEFYVDDDEQETAVPEVDGLAVVHITETGTDLYEVADPASAWTAFKHVAWLATQMDSIKAQITEPTA